MKQIKECKFCKKEYTPKRRHQIFCSPTCRLDDWKKNNIIIKFDEFKKICPECNKEFLPRSKNHIYCSNECCVKKYKEQRVDLDLSTGIKGAISELFVCQDLLKKGFEVYRSISQCSSRDIIAIKDNKTYDIEVRTGCIGIDGNKLFGKHNIKAVYTAIVINKMTEIVYEPDFTIE